MKTYLANVEYAVKKIFAAINHDSGELIDLLTEREAALKKPGFLQELGMSSDLQEDFDEHRVMNYYAQAHAARQRIEGELKDIDERIHKVTIDIEVHRESVAILCGSLLQFAKQGISIAHRSDSKGLPETCPPGRLVGSTENLSNVIWQARNHAIHFEESPEHNQSVKNCFVNLAYDFGPQLSLPDNPDSNLSKEVIDALGWSAYARFEEDMLSLA